ncbi:MAG: tetratricopeptide repeat protein [Symploca sp. SIO2E9]|nr:tetratricopeptide repeat protein [Symploca sp. SIO2E9]
MTRHALVVGINQYPCLQDTPTSKSQHLNTPANDAEAIAKLLEDYGGFIVDRLPASLIDGKIQVAPNENVKAEELQSAITKLFLAEDDREMALLFFAGHGLQKPLGILKQILLATSDANPRNKKWNGLLLRDLWEIIEQSPVKKQIIWLDCCYSGELLKFKKTGLASSERNRFLIAASHGSEVAYDRLDRKHGVLSGALIAGLDPYGMAQNKWITDRKLADFVEEELKAYYSEFKIPQEPQIRRPDHEIQLILGKGSLNRNKQTEPKKSVTPEIPFILPQLDVSTFTGREEELSRLEELLLNPQGTKVCSIAGLAGVGGIGKSALACHFATIHEDKFLDGVIGLRVDGKDIDTIAREFARHCGEQFDSEDERDAATIMQEVFAHRRMLLIFDNAEDSSIQALRPGGNRCAVIITTRNRGVSILLDIPEQGRIDLSPLANPDSLLLLEKLIGKERINAEPEAADKLIKLAGNLPLALQIIGTQLKLNQKRTLTDYVASLGNERKRLEIIDSKREIIDPKRDEYFSLRACFSLSLKQLQPEQIDFFACLSVCAKDGFSRQTATAASGYDDQYDAQNYLDYLCRLSLLNYSEVGENRFVFHPLVRLFAHQLLVERGLKEDATQRHAESLINLVKSFNFNNRSSASTIGEEIDDIILAAECLQQKGIADYDFGEYLNEFFEEYGYWSKATNLMSGFQSLAESREDWEAVVIFGTRQAKYLAKQDDLSSAEQVLKALRKPDIISRIEPLKNRQRSEIKWFIRLGRIKQQKASFDEAENALQKGLMIAEKLGEQESLRNVLDSLGNIFQKQEKLDEAAVTFQRVIKINKALDDKRSVVFELNFLARILQKQNKLKQALETFQRSIEISQELDDQRQVAIGFNSVGMILQEQGKLDEALQAFEGSIEIIQELDDQLYVALALNNIGGILAKQDKLDEALEAFEQMVGIGKVLDDQRQVAIGLSGVGSVLQKQGKLDEALKAFERRVEISQELDDQLYVAIALNNIGGILAKQDKLDEALEAFEQVVGIGKILDNQRQVAIGLNSVGSILQKQGKLDEALKFFEDVVEISKAINDQRQVTFGLNGIGNVRQKQNKLDKALEAFKEAVEIYRILDDQRQVAIGLNNVGSILQKQEKLDQALEAFKEAVEIYRILDDQRQVAIGLNNVGCVFEEQGKLDEALKAFDDVLKISQALENQRQVAFGLNGIGNVRQKQDKLDEALEAFKQVAIISYSLNDPEEETKALYRVNRIVEQLESREAEMLLRRSYDSYQKINDKRGQAIILNSLGQLLSQQVGEDKFKLALMYFRESVKLGEALDYQSHLGRVCTAMGRTFLRHGDIEEAVIKFAQSFEINENLGNLSGINRVIHELTYALVELSRGDEALAYCKRALAVDPENQSLQELNTKISSQQIINLNSLKQGSVKFIRYDTQKEFHWGYIISNDGSNDIYFHEAFIGSECISQLKKGTLVEVEVRQTPKGLSARSIRIIDDFDSFIS